MYITFLSLSTIVFGTGKVLTSTGVTTKRGYGMVEAVTTFGTPRLAGESFSVFRHPPFDAILSGITVRRVLQLAQRLVEQGDLRDIKVGDLSVEEGHAAAEMMLLGSSIKVAPVVQWDGRPIGDGKPGPIARKLLDLWREDVRSKMDQLVTVAYPPE